MLSVREFTFSQDYFTAFDRGIEPELGVPACWQLSKHDMLIIRSQITGTFGIDFRKLRNLLGIVEWFAHIRKSHKELNCTIMIRPRGLCCTYVMVPSIEVDRTEIVPDLSMTAAQFG